MKKVLAVIDLSSCAGASAPPPPAPEAALGRTEIAAQRKALKQLLAKGLIGFSFVRDFTDESVNGNVGTGAQAVAIKISKSTPTKIVSGDTPSATGQYDTIEVVMAIVANEKQPVPLAVIAADDETATRGHTLICTLLNPTLSAKMPREARERDSSLENMRGLCRTYAAARARQQQLSFVL